MVTLFKLIILIVLLMLLVYPATWKKFTKHYRVTLQIVEFEETDKPYWKALKIFWAGSWSLFMSFIFTLYEIIKSEVVKTSENNQLDAYQLFVSTFNADWSTDERLKQLVRGFGWVAPGMFGLSFNERPTERELADLQSRCQSYGLFEGLAFDKLGNLDFYRQGGYWVVPILARDTVQEAIGLEISEKAKEAREKELDSLPIDVGFLMETEIPNEKGEYPLCFDRKGTPIYVPWSHTILAGATGSGKTLALKYLGNVITVSRRNTNDLLYILDYKRGRDWSYLAKHKADFYFSGEDVKSAFEEIFGLLEACISGEMELGDRIIWVIIDEFSSIVESFPTKKERDEFLASFGKLLRLGRNLGEGKGGFRVIVGLQQADASVFGGTSTRGNFGIRMALGGLTSEGARMLFDVTEDSDKPVSSKVGKGFIQVYGSPVQAMMMPLLTNQDDQEDWIMIIYATWNLRLYEERKSNERLLE